MRSPRRRLIFGSSGQLGRALAEQDPSAHVVGRMQANFLDKTQVLAQLDGDYDVVINAAAYTAVDRAEVEREQCLIVNALTPSALAQECARLGISLVHFSTDYVFDGAKVGPYSEEDHVGPRNQYGLSKLQGEQLIANSSVPHLIFRTSWVFSHEGHNFVKTMLRLGLEHEELKVVSDQVGSPTLASDLAGATLNAIEASVALKEFPSGIYHIAGSGQCSWFEFAEAIFEEAKKWDSRIRVRRLIPVPSSEYPTPAARPRNSVLCQKKLNEVFGIKMPHWRDSLVQCLKRVYENR